MNHAFLIIAHNHPQLLRSIVDSLQSSNHYIFIHIDLKADLSTFTDALKDLDNKNIVFLNNRIKVYWGGFSQIQCELLLLKAAYSFVPQMDYFHLISGVDYPCRSNKELDSFFESHNGESFMHYDSNEEIQMWRNSKYRDRIQSWNFIDLFPYIPISLRHCMSTLFTFFVKRRWIPDVVAGWNWFSWHRSVVYYVFSYIKKYPEYLKRFKYTTCCDEVIFHTLLQYKTTELNINKYNSLRFIEWHPKRAHSSLPLVLEETEYNEIINSSAMFCRKVDPIKSKVLIEKLKKHIQ